MKKQKPSEIVKNPKRDENESYEEYRERRENENKCINDWLKGRPTQKD